MINLGEQFRNERNSKELTLREVSEVLKIDQSLISKFEKNERKPTKEQVIKLAEYYELSIENVLNDWHSDRIVDNLVNCLHPGEVLEIAKKKIENLREVNDEE